MTKFEFTSSSLSVSHTCGNVLAYITDLVQTWFTPEFFKTVNVSTTMAYRYFNILQNSKAEHFRKKKPYLIIQPRINPEGGRFLAGTMLTERINPQFDGGDYGNLQPFIRDDVKGYDLKFLLNRMSMSFDVSIIVETQKQQIDTFQRLKNRLVWNRPLDWEAALECHIPREMIAAISAITNIPMSEPGHLLHYMNSNSVFPVTYKLKNSTGNDEYFRYYPTLIDAELKDLNLDSGNKSGIIDDAYAITFTIDVEFNASGLYQIISKTPIPKFWEQGGEAIELDETEIKNNRLYADMLLTPYRDLGVQIPPGWKVYSNPSFRITATKPDPDILDFRKLISPSLQRAIHYHMKMSMPLEQLLKVYVLKDYERLDPEKGDYFIDYEDFQLYTYNLNKMSTYRMLVIVNVEYMNRLIKDLLDMDER